MQSFLQALSYVSFVTFVVAFVVRTKKMARLPVHLRWDMHPIPGRTPGLDTKGFKKRHRRLEEAKYMAKEILLFRTHYHCKKDYWYAVFPLHLSMYLFIVWMGLCAGCLLLFSKAQLSHDSASVWVRIVFYMTVLTGSSSFLIGMFSSAALMIKRLLQEDLRLHTTPVIYLNLGWAFAIFASGFIDWLFWDTSFSTYRGYLSALVHFDRVPAVSPFMATHIVLLSLFMAYLPFTRMMHFVAKYFIYHKVLWEPEQSLHQPKIEAELAFLLGQAVGWSGPHIPENRTWNNISQ
jgi:nitrate reductase gamma subunit